MRTSRAEVYSSVPYMARSLHDVNEEGTVPVEITEGVSSLQLVCPRLVNFTV